MLAHLTIHNLAVVDEVELELAPGFNVLTGETGAGKSILVDALALALGERADSRAIRKGAARCEITAGFNIGDRPDLLDWLRDNDLDDEADCILRRIVTAEGRSRGYVNGRAVPMQTLKNIGERLVDICGQQSHQSLRHARVQRDIVDQTGDHENLVATMSDSFEKLRRAREELDLLTGDQNDRIARQELLGYQVDELQSLALQPGELEQLEREHALISNSARLTEGLSLALDRLYEAESGGAQATIHQVNEQLKELAQIDRELEPVIEMLGESEILVSEAVAALRDQARDTDHDPRRLVNLEQRISSIYELARKHRVDASTLPELTMKLAQDLENLRSSDERVTELREIATHLEAEVQDVARSLTGKRQRAAKKLAALVTENMRGLGMPGGVFAVQFHRLDPVGSAGAERVEFMVSINPGQLPAPVATAASGGELSRISLAIQVVAMGANTSPTLIFDEVDAGVGGGVAEIVGTRLRELSAQRQVLCVTHLPQVACQADHHLRVSKMTDGETTRTSVNSLNSGERVEEIARMLGGVEITDRTRAHAGEMLDAARRAEKIDRAG